MWDIQKEISALLEGVSACTQRTIPFKTSSQYNLFQVLEVETREVIMCRFLADLLNPNGKHGQKTVFLKSFIEQIWGEQWSEEMLRNTVVTKEYTIDAERRIDIVIQNNKRFIPIEVKINAADQPYQCSDYYDYARQFYPGTKVLYLTKYGHRPSAQSLASQKKGRVPLAEDKVKCISWAKDILNWLKDTEPNLKGTVQESVTQFAAAIRDFTNWREEENRVKTEDLILQTENSLWAALQVEKAIKSAKAKNIQNLFCEFELQMQPLCLKYGLEKETSCNFATYEQNATEDFYKTANGTTYPGLNYLVKRVRFCDADTELWFRIEIEHALTSGLCVFSKAEAANGKVGCPIHHPSEALQKEIQQKVQVLPQEQEDWWIVWQYLPTVNITESVPDFNAMNSAAIQLAEENQRKAFVKRCIEIIETNILSKIV